MIIITIIINQEQKQKLLNRRTQSKRGDKKFCSANKQLLKKNQLFDNSLNSYIDCGYEK